MENRTQNLPSRIRILIGSLSFLILIFSGYYTMGQILVPDNPDCCTLSSIPGLHDDSPGNNLGLKIEGFGSTGFNLTLPMEPGTYVTLTCNAGAWSGDPGNTITLFSPDGVYLDWSSTLPLDAVIMKGGPNANVYYYEPESYGDQGLHAPMNPNNNMPYGISHIEICLDYEVQIQCPDPVSLQCPPSNWDPYTNPVFGFPTVIYPSVYVCNNPTLTWSDSSDGQTCPQTITRTWTITDDCGDEASCTQTITILDEIDPVMNCPGALTATCSLSEHPAYGSYAEFLAAGGTASDNCGIDESSFILLSETSDNSNCPEVITRIYQVADYCGNLATCSQTVTLDDDVPPVAPDPPAAASYQCISNVPAPGDLTATDNCAGDITVTGVDNNNGGAGCASDPLIITRTWTFTDNCGNSTSVSQSITVIDDTDPIPPDPPASESYQCESDVPPPGDLSATDNCSGVITTRGVDTDNGGTGCVNNPLIITRTWTFTDDCGNSASVSQVITVIDNTAPVPPTPPPAASYQCVSEVPPPGNLTASDNCLGDISVTGIDTDNGGTGCTGSPLVITRIWTFTDNCGNSSSVSQTITVIDNIPPSATAPANESYQCAGDVPPPGDLTATDNCSGDITVTGADTDNGGSGCAGNPLVITRTWTFTDLCGNSASVSQTITVIDNIPPVAIAPANESYQCAGDVPAPGDLTATDNCSASITVTGVDTDNGGTGCANDPLIITRTWAFTDDCGNSSAVSQTITVIDDTPPSATAPANQSYQCQSDVPPPGDLTATDNCSGDITVTGIDSDNGGSGCLANPLVITRTWTFTDDCGNVSSISQTLTVIDNTNPVPPTPPVDEYYQCFDEVPAPGDLTATDNCSDDITVTGIDSDNGGAGCFNDPLVITRTWTFVDDCGNSSSTSQTITVVDDTAPVPPVAPEAESYQCADEVPAPGQLTATDNCSEDITVTGVDSDNGGAGCTNDPLIITRTWTFTDDCGNSASVSQIITVIDDTDPLPPDAPAPEAYQCLGDVPAPGQLTATDNCADDITVTGVDSDNGGAGCTNDPLIITRTWTFADDCGNSASVSQTITVIDDIGPVPPDAPAPEAYQCLGDIPLPGEMTATDNCGDITATGVDSDNGGAGCVDDPLIITRTWTFSDNCGNSASISQTITVIDDTPPVATPPDDATYQCADDVPAPGDLTASDNCSGDITVTGTDADNGGSGCVSNPLVITRTWMFTDDCGNSTSVSQTITVIDDTPPVANPPVDMTYQCTDDVPLPGDLTAIDNCSGEITSPGVDSDNGGSGCASDPLIITRSWSFTDDCGNSVSASQTITVVDDTPPTLIYAGDTYIEEYCSNFVYITVDASDNCDSQPEITCTRVDPEGEIPKDCSDPEFYDGTTTLTYVAVDDCGNESESLTITVFIDSPVPCEIMLPDQPPFCNMLENTAWAGPNTQAGAISYYWYFSQESIDNGWVITDGEQTPNVEYTSGSGTGYLYLSYVDTNSCLNECYVEIECIPTWNICTMTQGFYGNSGGKFCNGQGTYELLDSMFIANGGSLMVGEPGASLTVGSLDPAQCAINILPGGGPAKALDKDWTCDNLEPPIIHKKTGRLRNILVSQTLTLSLNMWLTPDLGDMPIVTDVLTIAPTTGCGPYTTGNYSINNFMYYQFPSAVLDELEYEYGDDPLISDLVDYANRGIGGENLNVSLSNIVEAVTLINEAFDECMTGTFDGGYIPMNYNNFAVTDPDKGFYNNPVDEIQMRAYPNPFSSNAFIEFTIPESDRVNLRLYTITGVKVADLFEGEVEPDTKYTVEFSLENYLSQEVFVYVLRTGKQIEHGRIIMIR